jgi:hypothetical protein
MKLDIIDRLVVSHIEKQVENKDGSLNMNALEQFGIMIILQVLNTVVKNPASKAAMQATLVGLANDIYVEYGMLPPLTPPAVAA